MIPSRKNAKPWKERWVRAAVRNEAQRACQGLGAGSGSNGAATTAEAWWRPRCTASNAWASGCWPERWSVGLWSCMCGWLHSTVSRNWGARLRCLCRCLLWRSCVRGWGYLGLIPVCATKLCTSVSGAHRRGFSYTTREKYSTATLNGLTPSTNSILTSPVSDETISTITPSP